MIPSLNSGQQARGERAGEEPPCYDQERKLDKHLRCHGRFDDAADRRRQQHQNEKCGTAHWD